MNASLKLRIAAVFIILIASALGICFPLLVNTENNLFRILNAGSAGVMLGLALIHLLPDADEILSVEIPGYGWAFAITAAGVVLVLAIEQFVFVIVGMMNEDTRKSRLAKSGSRESFELSSSGGGYKSTSGHDEECGIKQCPHSTPKIAITPPHSCGSQSHVHSSSCYSNGHDHGHDHSHDCGDETPEVKPSCASTHEGHNHHEEEAAVLANVLHATGLRALVTAYVMEISIAVHSIIIGVDLGLLAHSSEIPTLVSLLAALSFHQFIEGVGLGSTIQGARVSLGNAKLIGFVLIFSLTMPLGIVVGILTSAEQESHSQLVAKGVANALAAGSLLYISLTEMVGNYFHAHDLSNKPVVKLAMVGAFGLGALALAVIAIWA